VARKLTHPTIRRGLYAAPDAWDDPGGQASSYGCPAIRHQVLQIIEEILGDPQPACTDAQERLRRLVAGNPGRPERALLLHLMSGRSQPSG